MSGLYAPIPSWTGLHACIHAGTGTRAGTWLWRLGQSWSGPLPTLQQPRSSSLGPAHMLQPPILLVMRMHRQRQQLQMGEQAQPQLQARQAKRGYRGGSGWPRQLQLTWHAPWSSSRWVGSKWGGQDEEGKVFLCGCG